jgi:hypothetical protein
VSEPRKSVDVRSEIVNAFRRDLVGPGPGPADADLAEERLSEAPSRWYLTGFIAPAAESPEAAEDDPSSQEEMELGAEEPQAVGAGGAAGDQELPETPVAKRRFHPSSIGLTVLLPPTVQEVEAVITWGDYRTEPPLPPELLTPPDDGSVPDRRKAPEVEWVRKPQERTVRIPLDQPRSMKPVPDSTTPQLGGGRLELDMLARAYEFDTPNGTRQRVRAVTVFLVNRRALPRRRYGDLSYAFQARIELRCPEGILARHDLSGYRLDDEDVCIADLHYRDVADYAVGRSTSAGWAGPDAGGSVTAAWTDPLPTAEVERVAPTPETKLPGVAFGMEVLAELAEKGSADLTSALAPLPDLYRAWIKGQHDLAATLERPRQQTANKLLAGMVAACNRIAEGIALLGKDDHARRAFRFMNEAVAAAARRRNAGPTGDPTSQPPPKWRPFQLAFILLNLAGLVDKAHPDREAVDLLFFPTGGGKTEAYLGLAAFAITHRRLTAGETGAGVTVIMRYTLRLLTLDQLSRAAGVVCALELARTDPKNANASGRPLLGTWPIEIGLWVGSDASPNRLGGKGNTGDDTAVTRVRKYRSNPQRVRAPAPIKACPWCGTPFTPQSFQCVPNNNAPRNLEIRCTNGDCDFTGNRALPILTVDEPIYRRLPAFLIATVDKFASLPWVGECGAFFGHVDRVEDGVGFYGAAEPGPGKPLFNADALLPPDLIIQDELHLISGPLGTVAGLYETAIDALATRVRNGRPIRPKIVASTATVRRAADQIRLLFDRDTTNIFPPPAVDRRDSFFAVTVPSSEDPARLYMGVAAQGRGPKLVFLRALTTLVAAAQAEYEAAEAAGAKPNPADPYMTALCYFNALRELGGARRIVEDDVRARAASYGSERVRVEPSSRPFKDRRIREPLELTSRVSTDKVAEAKQRLEAEFSGGGDPIDVALATNMISVGLDITRLGLMLVLGQPKTAAEYIQATSRVGRDHNRPGLVVTVLNLHKPRDRTHYESFRQFHCTFYRAVEATSVTPWAARALDRALAAIVVAVARHLEPLLTPENAVRTLRDHDLLRTQVMDGIVARAKGRVVGGDDQLRDAVTTLLEAWMTTADEQTANGVPFAYSRRGASSHLLHNPLDPALENLTQEHRRFVAGRSMRDVEPNVVLKVRDPWGGEIRNAGDLE